jgi:ubiquinone/menaquinone biosynthesis C-methylase UbiE
MDKIRKPFQGVSNILRFNWHFYVLAVGAILFLLVVKNITPAVFQIWFSILALLIFTSTFISLLVSYYIYDGSNLYQFNWLPNDARELNIVNISAGFDETSALLQAKFANANLTVLDFYNPTLHTEVSIKRARKAYPAYANTKTITSTNIDLPNYFADKIFVIFSAHEIRIDEERIVFFKELKRIVKPNGQIIIVEHLRNINNFIAYNIGCLHFLSNKTWLHTFCKGELKIVKIEKLNPFISTFTLQHNGDTP